MKVATSEWDFTPFKLDAYSNKVETMVKWFWCVAFSSHGHRPSPMDEWGGARAIRRRNITLLDDYQDWTSTVGFWPANPGHAKTPSKIEVRMRNVYNSPA
jgi:hypothetical protein